MKIGMGLMRVVEGMGTRGEWSTVYYFTVGVMVVGVYDFDLWRLVVAQVAMVAGRPVL